MVQSVELLLDADAEAHVTAQWTMLVDAGLPSQGRHTGATNRPHVTVAVARALGAEQESAIGTAVSGRLPVPLRLGGLLVFGPGPFILCRLVVASSDLLALQQRVVAAIGPTPDAFGHQAPGGWTPHVTLARRVTADQLAVAVQLLSPMPDLPTAAAEVRRWDGEQKIAWVVAGSDRAGSDEDADQIRHHHGNGTQQ